MLKKLLAFALACVMIQLACIASAFAGTKAEKEVQFAEKVKAGIAKLGVGPQARVEIKLRDGTKLKGYVSEVSDDHFVVVDPKTGTGSSVSYPQVKQVKGNNLSTGVKIAIAVVLVVVIGAILGIKFAS